MLRTPVRNCSHSAQAMTLMWRHIPLSGFRRQSITAVCLTSHFCCEPVPREEWGISKTSAAGTWAQWTMSSHYINLNSVYVQTHQYKKVWFTKPTVSLTSFNVCHYMCTFKKIYILLIPFVKSRVCVNKIFIYIISFRLHSAYKVIEKKY